MAGKCFLTDEIAHQVNRGQDKLPSSGPIVSRSVLLTPFGKSLSRILAK